jgi:arylsulfatase
MRQRDCKFVFAEQRLAGMLRVWAEPLKKRRLQKIFDLFQEPCELADITSNNYWDWNLIHVGSACGMMEKVFKFAATFKEYPPRSSPPSFIPSNVLEQTLDEVREARKKTK